MNAGAPKPSPKVSIIMAAYNAERYIASAIASMREQTMSDWELIVIDDGSTDTTASIVGGLARDDCRIRLVSQANSGRPGVARNVGLSMARGRFIGFLDADDTVFKHRLEICNQLFGETEECGFLFHDYATIDEKGHTLVESDLKNMGFLDDPRIDTASIRSKCNWVDSSSLAGFMTTVYVACTVNSVLLRRDAFSAGSLKFREDVAVGEDLDLWLNLLWQAPVLYIDQPLSSYRQHATSITMESEKFKHDTIQVLESHSVWIASLGKPGLVKRYQRRLGLLHAQLGYLHLMARNNVSAEYWFTRGFLRYRSRRCGLGIIKACLPWAWMRGVIGR